MRVFVNNNEIHLAEGMTVRHAVIGAGFFHHIETGEKTYDEWGNEIGLDGAVSENYRIYVRGDRSS